MLSRPVSLSIGFIMDKCLAEHHPTPPLAFTWRKLTPPSGLPGTADPATRLGEVPHLSCESSQEKKRDCMERLVTPPRRGTSPTWGPPPSCKQALRVGPYREKLWPQAWKCCPRPTASVQSSVHVQYKVLKQKIQFEAWCLSLWSRQLKGETGKYSANCYLTSEHFDIPFTFSFSF